MENRKVYEVVAAVIVKDGDILAAQRGYGDFKGKWEFPGGKMKAGETREQALKREIKEELLAEIDILNYLTTVNYEYPDFDLIMHTYICSLLDDAQFVYHNDSELEHDNLIWLDNEDLEHVDWLPADVEVIKAYQKTLHA